MATRRCKYQEQDSNLTLREALKEYHDANPHLFDSTKSSAETNRFFQCHDRIHVVFGCDTSFAQEARTDCWTMMGTDLGTWNYFKLVASPVIRDLYRDLKSKMTPDWKIIARQDIRVGLIRAAGAPF